MRTVVKCLIFLCGLCISLTSAEAKSEDVKLFIDFDLNEKTVYEHQTIQLTAVLYSTSADIAYANPTSDISLSKGAFDVFKRITVRRHAYKKEIDGTLFYCFPLESYAVSFAQKGNYVVRQSPYDIGVSFPVVVNDPFWGAMRTSDVKNFKVDVKDLSIKVKTLPSPPRNMDFSGSVGEFHIETIVPRGDIFRNEEATAFIVLKGSGMLANSTLPEYRNAFKEGLKLKSVSESRSEYIENGKVVSEIRLECTFIPESGSDMEIGEIRYDYFDPFESRYKTATSAPVKVTVKSAVSKRDKISI